MGATTTKRWQQLVWIGAGLALLGVIGALVWFVGVTINELVAILAKRHDDSPFFLLSGISIVTLTLIRMLAVLLGGAIAFAGLAVSFFTHQQETTVESNLSRDEKGAKLTLATYSPGIIAMVIGAAIIVFALYAKTTYSSKGGVTPMKQVEQPQVPMRPVPRPIDELPEPEDTGKPVE